MAPRDDSSSAHEATKSPDATLEFQASPTPMRVASSARGEVEAGPFDVTIEAQQAGTSAEAAAIDSLKSADCELIRELKTLGEHRRPLSLGSFGDYELIGEIARGGMGVVYQARQRGLNRNVAIKMILAGRFASESEVQRFYIEAEAAANLQHPNIVAIYEVGEHEGNHFYSMEYIEGTSLAELVRENPLPADRAARYVRTVASAIHFAHLHGTLHRDLKPSNVLIDSADTPKVADFGLAKRSDGDSQLTGSMAHIGTPCYMPPEQARGDMRAVGPHSDVYSLGAVLYELVTGRPPFRAANPFETMNQVIADEPAPPRLLNPRVPADLETICLKCLQKEPTRRYTTAEELAEDLGRYERGEPILARRTSIAERGLRWCKRKPALATLAGLLVLVALGGMSGILWQWRQATVQKDRAEEGLDRLGEASTELMNVIEQLVQRMSEVEIEGDEQRALVESGLKLYDDFLNEQTSSDAGVRARRADMHRRVGKIRDLLGLHDQAKGHHDAAIAEFSLLSTEFPDRPELRRAWGDSLNWFGESLRMSDRFTDAAEAYDSARAVQEGIVADFPLEPTYRADLARSHYNLGLVHAQIDRPDDGRRHYEKAIELLEPLATGGSATGEFRQGLARAQQNLGLLMVATGAEREFAAADRAYTTAISLLNSLAAESPRAEFRDELAVALTNRGNLWYEGAAAAPIEEKEAHKRARDDYQQAIQNLEALSIEFVGVPRFRFHLALAHNGLGSIDYVQGKRDDARRAFAASRDSLDPLVRRFPNRVEYLVNQGAALSNLARVERQVGNLPAARALLDEAIDHQERALAANPLNPIYQRVVQANREQRLAVLVEMGIHDVAAREAERLPELASDDWKTWYKAAEILAQCALIAQSDAALSPDLREAAAAQYATDCVAMLDSAIAHGLDDPRRLASQPAFRPLVDRADFRELVVGLESRLIP